MLANNDDDGANIHAHLTSSSQLENKKHPREIKILPA